MKLKLDSIGAVGLFIAALASPCCFPLFAFVLSAFGLGSVELFGGWTAYVFEGLVLLSLIGFYLSYRLHKNIIPFIIGLMSGGLIAYAFNISYDNITIYLGMFGLFAATGLNYYINRKHSIACKTCTVIDGKNVELASTITCPNCNHKKTETMPTDACQFFYECENCQTVIKAKPGDCCVYCSYGSVKCPPLQLDDNCC